MKRHCCVYIFLQFFNFVYGNLLQVKRFGNCYPNVNYTAIFNATFRTVDQKQYVDSITVFASPLDNTLRFNITVDILVGKDYVYLLTIHERKACEALHKYFGEFVYDLERHTQLIPGMCPLPTGIRKLHNHYLDFEKMPTLVNFPFGNLRLRQNIYTAKDDIYTCLLYEVEHRI